MKLSFDWSFLCVKSLRSSMIVLFVWSVTFMTYTPVFANIENGEKRIFTLTGYYSPLPDQAYFLTGSYESEIRLNGHGIASADGTPVFPGMIAAPSNYEFGTKICLPNFGCGSVHDRGGAIVKKGERKLARHDRLDLWMGYGLDGMNRALALGVKHVEGTIYKEDAHITVAVNFSAATPMASIIDLPTRVYFRNNLALGDEGEEVQHLQEYLADLGFFTTDIDGDFDEFTEQAVFDFQQEHYVVDNKSDLGAGRFGPQTRNKLSEVMYHQDVQKRITAAWENLVFEEDIAQGDRSQEVAKLQKVLVLQEYLEVSPTGFFGPKTKEALVAFQLDNGLIKNQYARGAGNFGPKTKAKINDILKENQESVVLEKEEILAYKSIRNEFNAFAGKPADNRLVRNSQ